MRVMAVHQSPLSSRTRFRSLPWWASQTFRVPLTVMGKAVAVEEARVGADVLQTRMARTKAPVLPAVFPEVADVVAIRTLFVLKLLDELVDKDVDGVEIVVVHARLSNHAP